MSGANKSVAKSTIAMLVLPVALVAAVADAQPWQARPDGWVTENGRILREGEARPTTYAVRPATRADWIGECNRRLVAANRGVDTGIGFDGTCRAWLDYYESIGAAAHGYDFAYAIPVKVMTETRITTIMATPCNCAPAPAPAHREQRLHDKRVPM